MMHDRVGILAKYLQELDNARGAAIDCHTQEAQWRAIARSQTPAVLRPAAAAAIIAFRIRQVREDCEVWAGALLRMGRCPFSGISAALNGKSLPPRAKSRGLEK